MIRLIILVLGYAFLCLLIGLVSAWFTELCGMRIEYAEKFGFIVAVALFSIGALLGVGW